MAAQLDLDESDIWSSVVSAAAAAWGGPFGAIVDIAAKGPSNIAGNAHAFTFEVQDWVDDYQVAWAESSVSMTGEACDFEGPLVVSLSGLLSSGGGSAEVRGTMTVTLGPDLRGTADGTIDVVAGPVTMSSTATGVTTVLEFNPRTGAGVLRFSGGTVSSRAAGQIANVTFEESLGAAPGAPVTVTAQAGDFCEET